jgi:hypothetical protein
MSITVKTSFTLLLVLTSFGIQAQDYWEKVPGNLNVRRHMIIFKNHSQYYMTKILDGEKTVITTKTGDTVNGKITRISGDTIFILDAALLLADVQMIGHHTEIPKYFGPGGSRPTYKYRFEPDVWEPVVPPESIYATNTTYYRFISKASHSLHRENDSLNNDPHIFRNFIKLNLARLIHLELSFAYERSISPHFSWETEASYTFGIQEADAHYTIDYPIYNYNGLSILTAPKYLFCFVGYLTPVLLYRYQWFTGVRTDWPAEDPSGYGELQDQKRDDFAGSVRIGMMKRFHHIILDSYFGVGAKYIIVHQKIYGSYDGHDSSGFYWYNEDHSPNDKTVYLWDPVINLGIKLGFGFN